MKLRKTLAVAATALLGTLPMFAQTSTSEKTLTGVVGDAMCGPTHTMKGKSDAECTRACIKEGSKYALIVGKNVYTLEGHEAELDKYAGQKVVVTGAVNGESVGVKSVAPAKQ
jgi:hypothetical protein